MTDALEDAQLGSSTANTSFWMRAHYSFLSLRNIVWILLQHPNGLRASELNQTIRHSGLARTQGGKDPAPTTLYHYRRSLLQLGIVVRQENKLVIARDNPLVADLVQVLSREPELTAGERHAFSLLVINNRDCRRGFFDYFMRTQNDYQLSDFTESGRPVIWQVIWQEVEVEKGEREWQHHIVLSSIEGETLGEIITEVDIGAVLYGIRYWARDQLLLLDELFLEDKGNMMFPILEPAKQSQQVVIDSIIRRISSDEEWTVLSIRKLAADFALNLRVPIRLVFEALLSLYRQYPGYIALTPTALHFATITAGPRSRENLELRSYFHDETGRYISHIRLHRRLKDMTNG